MTPDRNWGYLLDETCDQVPGVYHALLVSGDGLRIATSRRLPPDQADQLAAYTSSVASLAKGAANLLTASGLMDSGPVEQNVTELLGGYIIVMAVDTRTNLTVLADKNCELGQVSYEMVTLANRIGGSLAPDVRAPLRA